MKRAYRDEPEEKWVSTNKTQAQTRENVNPVKIRRMKSLCQPLGCITAKKEREAKKKNNMKAGKKQRGNPAKGLQ